MRHEDDSDMKIAGDDFDDILEPQGESAEAVARLLEQEKANGNLSRARRLGAIMADEVSAIEGGDSQPAEDIGSLLTQRRILLAFAVEVGLDAFLPNNLVAQTAQNVFYNTLHITAPAFYDDLQESGAFSFYYMYVLYVCARRQAGGAPGGRDVCVAVREKRRRDIHPYG